MKSPAACAMLIVALIVVIAVFATRRSIRSGFTSPLHKTDPLCNSKHVQDMARLGGAGSVRPGPCTREGDWLIFPTAWTEAPGSEIAGGPKRKLTPGACQAFCENDPSCVAWVNDENSYCHGYSIVPAVMVGNTANIVGIRTSVLRQ